MIPATVKSIDIPPHLIRSVLLCFVPDDSIKMAVFPADNTPVVSADCDSSLSSAMITYETLPPPRHHATTIDL
jgi:hypothetical protein